MSIRRIIYYPLFWIRSPFLILSRMLGTLSFLFALLLLIAWFFGGHLKSGLPNWAASAILAGTSFLLFFLHHQYDRILASISSGERKQT